MERKYRIKANVGKDSVLNVGLKQDIDLYEILSLNISKDKFDNLKRENTYKLFSSDYGVIVGRVLANDAFGVPNARVSVFIPISKEDELRTDIKNIYPYSFVTDYNNDNIRYNTLPNYSVSECYTPVGTFPNKRLILDNDTVLEIYDKYYKYTTVTNNAGDYMIFGVPVGEQIIHTDIDLSDIGVLSQTPSDFLSKGYTIDMFDSASKFKKSTNLDNLAQIFSDNTSVNVYSLWGDRSVNEIAITRKDIRLQYKFETSCVFLGSIITDSPNNSIDYGCEPGLKMGEAGQLVASEGTIEMIRMTVNDTVEEYSINGNRLIDSDGVFCYQIPMNLDFVQTDEYGNIVPTDNPKKGIATRARVRFRITLTESGSESVSSHKARYLIPNNPDINDYNCVPQVPEKIITDDDQYIFGTNTPKECFRDLYWNKVYSVKNYIPRLQKNIYDREQHYLALKGVNKKEAGNLNPLPFNKLNLNISLSVYYILNALKKSKDEDDGESIWTYIKNYWNYIRGNYSPYSFDSIVETVVDDMDGVGLDFYNDWLNGCLYFPNWNLHISNDKNERFFCECKKDKKRSSDEERLFAVNNCSIYYKNTDLQIHDLYENNGSIKYAIYSRFINSSTEGSKKIDSGIIRMLTNNDGAEIFYYAFGDKVYESSANNSGGGQRMGGQRSRAVSITESNESENNYVDYIRLFSTDIILLGSLKDNDIHSIPKVKQNYPITSSHIPSMGIYKCDEGDDGLGKYDSYETNYNGMNWGSYWFKDSFIKMNDSPSSEYGIDSHYSLGSGLFFGINIFNFSSGNFLESIMEYLQLIVLGFPFRISLFKPFIVLYSDFKTGPNAERISELGVKIDSNYYSDISGCRNNIISKDGLITSKEIENNESRAYFASLNSNKLVSSPEIQVNGYNSYKLCYLYPVNFDGRLEKLALDYTSGETKDYRDKDYLDYRLGSVFKQKRHFYYHNEENNSYAFPLYENSFYFYFGLNPGKTAIEKFYSNYMGKCTRESDELLFDFKIDTEITSACKNDGKISITLENINSIVMPYEIVLLDANNNELSHDLEQYNSYYTFENLKAGSYAVKITDSAGYSVTKSVVIQMEGMSLNTSSKEIGIKYDESNPDVVCDEEKYGSISIISYNAGSSEDTKITALTSQNIEDNKKYSFKPDDSEKFTIYFEAQGSDYDLRDCICFVDDEGTVADGNKIRIKKPGTYIISIVRNDCPVSYTSSTETVTDGKYIEMRVGTMQLKNLINEDNTNSQTIFYNPTKTENNNYEVNDVKGWFGVHNPDSYINGFNSGVISNVETTVVDRLKRMFNLSNSVYIESTTKNNTLNISLEGENVLLRTAHPVYTKNSWADEDDFITENNNLTLTANNKYPNIVSKNYVYTDNSRVVENNYEFNKEYYNHVTHSGNYIACFGNNARIEMNGSSCYRAEGYEDFTRIPAKADDLYNYSEGVTFCTSDSSVKNEISPKVYSRTIETSKPYFRTEFIDRRFDYDLLFITPTKFGEDITDWNCARLSGNTYNGIEMAYTDEDKSIVSVGNDTEYQYDSNTGIITLYNGKKRFYDSKIIIGNNSYQIKDLYYSSVSTPTSLAESVISVVSHNNNEFSTKDTYKNFGISNGNIVGYPTTRLIDLKIKEYNENYKYSVTNCSYDISNISINAVAKEGETTSCDLSIFKKILDTNNPPKIKCRDISVNGAISASTFQAYFDSEFASEATQNNYLYKIITDNQYHDTYKSFKTSTSLGDNYFDNLITESLPIQDPYSTTLEDVYGKEFVGILIKKVTKDDNNNLTKKITLIDASTFFRIRHFTCAVSKDSDTNYANVRLNLGASVTIDGTSYPVSFTRADGTADAKKQVYKVMFAGGGLTPDSIEFVQCELFRGGSSSMGTFAADYSGENNAYYVSVSLINGEHVLKMIVYVKIDGIVYYFNVNNLNG